MTARQTYSVDDVKAMLRDRVRDVAHHFAPPRSGSYELNGGWWTLNPGRADNTVGSFVVWLDGPNAGRWNDYATGQRGDLLDLIALYLGCDLKDAFREARAFLGLQSDSPEDVARREAAIERARAREAEARRTAAETAERKRRAAVAIWLEAAERIAGTPVEAYLNGARAIDLARLGRQPRALRYHPGLKYQHVDPETGEVIRAVLPAMVAIASNGAGLPVAVHRTWLAPDGNGGWAKARLPEPKKVLGNYRGAAIHIWRGIGPRGGAGRRLAEAPPGSRVYLAEGIEDALSVAMALPEARVLAGISLTNLGAVALPPNIAELVLVADRDEGEQARAALAAAIEAHAAQGRTVRLWQNAEGGKDVNDALRARARNETDNNNERGAA